MMLSKKALVRFGIGEYHPNHANNGEMVDTMGQEILGVTTDEGNNMLKAFIKFEGAPYVCHRLQNALKDDVAFTSTKKVLACC
mmetsp:Transcript_18303/g.32567  ORF Transcript_18303/g.32567 Transcript_18303/m.32567 type:complete len:83 (+) Transcript_18303:898-1146(+)